MSDGEDYVTINVDILRETARAVQCRCADGVPRWIPRSCIFGSHEKQINERVGELMGLKVFRWMAEKNKIPLAR